MLQSLSAKAARMAFVRRVWTALPLLIWTLCVRAATGQSYYFKTLDVGDGLSQNTVGQIIQDRLGFMWFGTREGLNRYDGLAFRVYRKDNSGLGKNFVTALYEDSGGRIWTGTDGGVYVYSPREDAFAAFDLLSDRQTRVTGYVTCIAGEGEEVWIASEGQGLFCHDCRTGALRHLFQTQGAAQCEYLSADGRLLLGGVVCGQSVCRLQSV